MTSIDSAMSQTVTTMWESVLGTDIQTVGNELTDVNREHSLVGCIHVTGPEGGVVTLECSDALARTSASAMFHMSLEDVQSADAEDSLGELTNIIGGNFKAMLSDGHQLSLPTVVEGKDFRTRFIGTRLASRVGFLCSGEPLVASFFREGARAT
ncbi:MAG: chemotaxis protein CheX, partial [Gemmatimonadaceae bacterium]